jgi:ATP-dependent Clp protease ATP-binding subunit ClpB
VLVEPPNVETRSRSWRAEGGFEVHHGVRIRMRRFVAAAVLRTASISDRFLPDKAIDHRRCRRRDPDGDRQPPAELDSIDRRRLQLEIEREALKREKDAASKERLGRVSAGSPSSSPREDPRSVGMRRRRSRP